MMNTTTAAAGSKVSETQGLSTTELAARIRADIKAAVKAGKLPKAAKYSVRTEYYSMGSSITVKANDLPFAVVNPDAYYVEGGSNYVMSKRGGRHAHFTVEAAKVQDALDAIVDAYHWDESDSSTDYFHSRFARSVEVEAAKGEFAAMEEKLVADAAEERAAASTAGLVAATGW